MHHTKNIPLGDLIFYSVSMSHKVQVKLIHLMRKLSIAMGPSLTLGTAKYDAKIRHSKFVIP